MRTREEINNELSSYLGQALNPAMGQEHILLALLETNFDLRDQNAQIISLFSERHTRREKEKSLVCDECNNMRKILTGYEDRGNKIHPTYKICTACQPANTH